MVGSSLEKLHFHQRDCGNLSLELTEEVGWRDFPKFANELLLIIGGCIVNKAESVEMRLWKLRFATCEIALVYDDFPQMVTLESDDVDGDNLLRLLCESLKDIRKCAAKR